MAGSLNPLEFVAAAASLKLDMLAVDAARRVLVGGESQTDVAARVGTTRQNVNYWVKRVSDSYLRQSEAIQAELPTGWEARLIAAPADKMERMAAVSDAELALCKASGGHDD